MGLFLIFVEDAKYFKWTTERVTQFVNITFSYVKQRAGQLSLALKVTHGVLERSSKVQCETLQCIFQRLVVTS